jgi:hypothetical protein
MTTTHQPPSPVTTPVLTELARRFPHGFVERKDGNDYVAHHIVNQRLLTVVGPFDFELVEVIRGDVAAVPPDPGGRSRRAKAGTPALHDAIVGGVWRLTCTIDGRRVRVEEVGDVGDVHNWPHDGARLKDAASDALKRCAMRLGLGLHLWAQEHYFLDHQLRALDERTGTAAEAEEAAADPGQTDGDDAGQADGSDSGQAAARVPARGADGFQEPDEALVERYEALAGAAGVSPADASEFLRRSPLYGGVADPRDLHGPALARLVERMGQRDDGPSGLLAFKAKVRDLLGDEPATPAGPDRHTTTAGKVA